MNYFKNNNNEIFAYDDTQTPIANLTPITLEEVQAIQKAKEDEYKASAGYRINEAKAYLASTDYKVLPDYDGDTTGIIEARAEARKTIRTLEVL